MVNQSKREYLASIKDRYRHAGKHGKSRILDEFCAVCGHHRKHAIRLLNKDARTRKKKPGRPHLGPVSSEYWRTSGCMRTDRVVHGLWG